MKLIPYFLYLVLIGFYVVIGRDLLSIYGAEMNLPALLVIMVSLYKDDVIAGWFGFAAGLVMAAAAPDVLGWMALMMASLALTCCFVRVRLNLDSIKTRLLVVVMGILIYSLFNILIIKPDGFFSLRLEILSSLLYSSLVAWLFFLIKDGFLTMTKLRSIF